MLTIQRRQVILEFLKRDGQVLASELSRDLKVSDDTIRRDLREMAEKGELLRVHGGALPSAIAAGPLVDRRKLSIVEKSALGRTAVELIQPGSIIAIDGGTSNLEIVRHMPKDLKVTVVTHSPFIAVELENHPFIEIILIGGQICKHSMVSVGTGTLDTIRKVRTDIFFLGATGIHSQAGLTTGDYEEARIKEAFCENAAETVLLASPEKLQVASPYQIIPLSRLNSMIVSAETDSALVDPFIAAGIKVTHVRAGGVNA